MHTQTSNYLHVTSHRMDAHTSIGWKLTSVSDGLSDFHGCTFTFQSMETFFTFFARFLTPPHFSPPIHLYPVHHNSHPTYPFHPLPKRSNFYFTSIPPSFITQKSQPFPQSGAVVIPYFRLTTILNNFYESDLGLFCQQSSFCLLHLYYWGSYYRYYIERQPYTQDSLLPLRHCF